jgi:hypothetical protein
MASSTPPRSSAAARFVCVAALALGTLAGCRNWAQFDPEGNTTPDAADTQPVDAVAPHDAAPGP